LWESFDTDAFFAAVDLDGGGGGDGGGGVCSSVGSALAVGDPDGEDVSPGPSSGTGERAGEVGGGD
jgi:hypothetical protein